MEIIVLGRTAAPYGALLARQSGRPVAVVAEHSESGAREIAERLGATRWSDDPLAVLPGPDDASVILGSDVARPVELARIALTAGRPVLLADVPVGEEQSWAELAARSESRLTLSRPLRFDRLFAATKAAIRTGDVGTPRTVQIAWTFDLAFRGSLAPPSLAALATELADVALWLLDDAPSVVYAASCAVEGPPLIQVNLQTQRGSLALIEASVAAPGLPVFRDVSLQATDGAIYHRTTQDDLLWTTSGVEVLSYLDDALAQECAVWTGPVASGDADLARGEAITNNIAVMRAIVGFLPPGQTVSVAQVNISWR